MIGSRSRVVFSVSHRVAADRLVDSRFMFEDDFFGRSGEAAGVVIWTLSSRGQATLTSGGRCVNLAGLSFISET